MTQQLSIEEGNKLIAEFMGCKTKPNGLFYVGDKVWDTFPNGNHYARLDQLAYHSSWNWLMPVVEKVESIYDDFHGYFGVYINSNSCTIQGTKLRTDPENFHPAYMSDPNAILDTKIASTWYNIIQFILWYNTQTKPLTT